MWLLDAVTAKRAPAMRGPATVPACRVSGHDFSLAKGSVPPPGCLVNAASPRAKTSYIETRYVGRRALTINTLTRRPLPDTQR